MVLPNRSGFRTFNVLQSGARGPDIDNTPFIRNAIRMAEASGGGIVYFPAATYPVQLQQDDTSDVCLQLHFPSFSKPFVY
jgi:polygalacturonase